MRELMKKKTWRRKKGRKNKMKNKEWDMTEKEMESFMKEGMREWGTGKELDF